LVPSAAAVVLAKGLIVEDTCELMITFCEGAKGTPMRFSFTPLFAK
jgi:hypothetical protein